jgi:hypothetical protein
MALRLRGAASIVTVPLDDGKTAPFFCPDVSVFQEEEEDRKIATERWGI